MRRRGLWSGHQKSISSSHSRRGLPPLIFLFAGLGSNHNRIVVAQDVNPKSAFTFPDKDDMTFYQKDTVLVSYVSSFPDPGLYAWCKDDKGGITNVYTNDHAASFNGTQPVLINFTFDAGYCWWNLRRQFQSPDGANGPAFKVADTEREGGSQTISQSSSSTTSSTVTSSSANSRQTGASTLTTTTSSSTTTSTNGASTNTSSPAPNDSGGLSTAAAAGIGVAVGVVVVVFLIALVIWLRKWKSNVIAEAVKATQSGSGGGGGSTFGSPGTGAASLQGMGELGGGGSPPFSGPVPVYATIPNVNNPDMGQIATTAPADAPGAVKYYYSMHGSEGILRAPEEMDSERHTAEMEGDNTYRRKFQGEQYR